jgi:hypothetical protein
MTLWNSEGRFPFLISEIQSVGLNMIHGTDCTAAFLFVVIPMLWSRFLED